MCSQWAFSLIDGNRRLTKSVNTRMISLTIHCLYDLYYTGLQGAYPRELWAQYVGHPGRGANASQDTHTMDNLEISLQWMSLDWGRKPIKHMHTLWAGFEPPTLKARGKHAGNI